MDFDKYLEQTTRRMDESTLVDFLLTHFDTIRDHANGRDDAACLQEITRDQRPYAPPRIEPERMCQCPPNTVIDFEEGIEICRTCGTCVQYIPEPVDVGGYVEHVAPPKTGYMRVNHFNEFMARFAGAEKTNIPSTVIDDVKDIIGNGRADMASIRHALRKLKLPKYYENWVQICRRVGGDAPPDVGESLQDKLLAMFQAAQGAFYHSKDAKRKNFFSYSYFVHKACQLLGRTEYLRFLPLLKCKKKLVEQDAMWRSLCTKLNWIYIPSTRQ